MTPEMVVAGSRTPGEVRVDGDDIWWSESRPDEGGRVELVRRRAGASTQDLLAGRTVEGAAVPSARTGLLEYGGGAWCVEGGAVVFAQWSDQRLYRVVADDPEAAFEPLTPSPAHPRGLRYGDLVALDSGWVLAVRETHPGESHPHLAAGPSAAEAVHEIVAVPTDGSAMTDPTRIRVLVAGPDFVGSPVPGPGRLAWIQWDHPRMPWDGTELCVARLGLDDHGRPELRGHPRVVAGGETESVVQPEWDRSGDLWFCSDRSGWWNLFRVTDPGGDGGATLPRPVAPVEAEIGGPRWVAGLCWYAPTGDGRVVAAVSASGERGLVLIDPRDGDDASPVPLTVGLGGAPVTVVSQVVAGPGEDQVVVLAASATRELTPLLIDLPPARAAGGRSGSARRRIAVPSSEAARSQPGTVEPSGPPGPDSSFSIAALRSSAGPLSDFPCSRPEPIEFPSAGGRRAHAILYRPTSATSVGPDGELPPLVVMIHGGPTSAARPMLDLTRQFWTSRGFAVVDVDYGGSTGYGRAYRQLLDGEWGVVDVEDCIAAARHLAAEGLVDGARLVIRGGSAGGFTTLAALCASDAFAAGSSLYGVGDLTALARDTHKFESHYLDRLVGPLPDAADVYATRSPLNHLDDLATPLLVLQGADDEVVPPNQAEAIVAALQARGVPHEYRLFEGEGHGFRKAETIVEALRAELAFYAQVLGFTPAEDL